MLVEQSSYFTVVQLHLVVDGLVAKGSEVATEAARSDAKASVDSRCHSLLVICCMTGATRATHKRK